MPETENTTTPTPDASAPPAPNAEPNTPAPAAEPPKPIEYGNFALPEGMTMNSEVLEAFKREAQGDKLPQERAQAYVNLAVKMQQQVAKDIEARHKSRLEEWEGATKADPEIGGAKLTGSLENAKLAAERFGTPAFKELLGTTGLGSHPEVIRFLAKIHEATKEDKIVTGGVPDDRGQKTIAQRMYPKSG